jgi:hypothetical protein
MPQEIIRVPLLLTISDFLGNHARIIETARRNPARGLGNSRRVAAG